MQMSS